MKPIRLPIVEKLSIEEPGYVVDRKIFPVSHSGGDIMRWQNGGGMRKSIKGKENYEITGIIITRHERIEDLLTLSKIPHKDNKRINGEWYKQRQRRTSKIEYNYRM